MKRYLCIMTALLLLVSCIIPVDDLGDSWDKGVIDKQLAGEWKQGYEEIPIWNSYLSFKERDGYYEEFSESASDDFGSMDTRTPRRCKTLLVGKHKYLMYDRRTFLIENNRREDAIRENLMKENNIPLDEEYLKAKQERKEKLRTEKGEGSLYLYRIENDVLLTYYLDTFALESAIESGEIEEGIKEFLDQENVSTRQQSLEKIDDKAMAFLASIAENPDYWEEPNSYKRITNLKEDLEKSSTYVSEDASNIEITVDIPDMEYFFDGKADVLMRQLQASPEWIVEKGVFNEIICYRRAYDDYFFHPSGGYESSKISPSAVLDIARKNPKAYVEIKGEQFAVEDTYDIIELFKFAKPGIFPSSIFDMRPRYHKEVSPTVGKIKLDVQLDDEGISSHLVVGKPWLSFEFRERTAVEPRTRTRKAFSWLKTFLSEIRKNEESIVSDGYAKSLMPKNAISSGAPRMRIIEMKTAGKFDVRAFVNSGEQGYVYLRVKDKVSGKYIEDSYGNDGKEYMGWSKSKETLFFYSTYACIDSDILKATPTITFELWFRPSDGLPCEDWCLPTIPERDRMLISADFHR